MVIMVNAKHLELTWRRLHNRMNSSKIDVKSKSLHGERVKMERKKRNNKLALHVSKGDNKGVNFQKLKNKINKLNATNSIPLSGNGNGSMRQDNVHRNLSLNVMRNNQKRSICDIGSSKPSPSITKSQLATKLVGVYQCVMQPNNPISLNCPMQIT